MSQARGGERREDNLVLSWWITRFVLVCGCLPEFTSQIGRNYRIMELLSFTIDPARWGESPPKLDFDGK